MIIEIKEDEIIKDLTKKLKELKVSIEYEEKSFDNKTLIQKAYMFSTKFLHEKRRKASEVINELKYVIGHKLFQCLKGSNIKNKKIMEKEYQKAKKILDKNKNNPNYDYDLEEFKLILMKETMSEIHLYSKSLMLRFLEDRGGKY